MDLQWSSAQDNRMHENRWKNNEYYAMHISGRNPSHKKTDCKMCFRHISCDKIELSPSAQWFDFLLFYGWLMWHLQINDFLHRAKSNASVDCTCDDWLEWNAHWKNTHTHTQSSLRSRIAHRLYYLQVWQSLRRLSADINRFRRWLLRISNGTSSSDNVNRNQCWTKTLRQRNESN